MTPNPSPITERVQSLYAAFGRGDLPALLAGLAPEVEWTSVGSPGMPYNRPARGHAAVGAWFQAVADTEAIEVFEVDEMLAGADHVTVLGHEVTVDRRSAARFDTPWIHVWRFGPDGRVRSFWGCYDTARVHALRQAH